MRRILRVEHLVPVTGLAIFLIVLRAVPEPPCTPAEPCAPDVPSWIALGALLAPTIMVYAHRGAAAWATVACAVCWLLVDRYDTEGMGWPALLPWLFAAVGVFVARHRATQVEHLAPRTAAPMPPALPRVGGRLLVLAGVVLAAAVALAGWVAFRQAAVDRQQAAARVVGGVVRERLGGDGVPAIRVALADGGTSRHEVLNLGDYPVGAPVQLYVDDRGLRQLRSEPYDITPLLALAVAGVGLALALLARAGRRRNALRDLFTTPQPVRTVRVADDYGYVHVLVPAADGRTALEFGIPVDENEPSGTPDRHEAETVADEHEPETVAGLLYGEPRTGRWCAVEVGGRVRVPVAPVTGTVEVPYDAEHHLPREVADDDAQAVDPAQLTAADRDAAPDQVREHRVTPLRRWFEAIAVGLGCTVTAGQIIHLVDRWRGWPAVATVAVVAGLAFEFGWRTQLRPRLRWDVGGLAAITAGRRERAMWTVDSGALHDDDGTVIVTTGDVVLVVDAPKPWPPWAPQRTADQLVAALRDARRQALDTAGAPAPPDLAVPGRPLVLYLAWIATVLGAVLLFGW